jgi:hypothetical protein
LCVCVKQDSEDPNDLSYAPSTEQRGIGDVLSSDNESDSGLVSEDIEETEIEASELDDLIRESLQVGHFGS